MKTIIDITKHVGLAIILIISAAPSVAGVDNSMLPTKATANGGNVLPPKAKAKGYSLSTMAGITAAFNVTDHTGTVIPIPNEVKNGKPFQGLFTTATNTFNISEGTMLYVPVIQNDDSPPVIEIFPNINDREALLDYFYSDEQVGVKDTKITVDGKETLLNQDYLVSVTVDEPLTDGGGTHYMTVAAFLTPLKKGQHTVVISARANGASVAPWCEKVNELFGFTYCTTEFSFTIPYIVNVR